MRKRISTLIVILLCVTFLAPGMGNTAARIKSQKITDTEKVLFLHSGGGPSIFNYAKDFSS